MTRISREVFQLPWIGMHAVELISGPDLIGLHTLPGRIIHLGGSHPALPVATVGWMTRDMACEKKLWMKVEDVVPAISGHNRSRRVDVLVSITAVSGEDGLPMGICFPGEHWQEGPAVDRLRRRATSNVDQRWQDVDPRHHRVRAGAGANPAWPGDDQRRVDAILVEVPLGEGPLGAMVAGVQKEGVIPEQLTGSVINQPKFGIHRLHGRHIPAPPEAGRGVVDMRWRNHQGVRVDVADLLWPRHVRPVCTHKQTKRLGALPLPQPLDRPGDRDVLVVGEVPSDIKTVLRRLVVVPHLAE